MTELISGSAEETISIGKKIAGFLTPGSVIALNGSLGSGKTCLTKGIAKGLGINENITSPTYTIISEYSGETTLYHIDVYRLKNNEDFENIGGSEIINGSGISVIEWSERVFESLPPDVITVSIEINGLNSRIIKIDGLEIQ
jgi:tRNA threonylcarbamoyladenosine biosynthesis protein TsaE